MKPESISQLRDIHGLDPISWWPPAPGWWLTLGALIVFAWISVKLFHNLRRYPFGSWQRDAWRQCRALKASANKLSERELATDISELTRRIAIARMGREHTAGLSGEAWLQWLQTNDPHGFNWSGEGEMLLTLPYAPPGIDPSQKNQLIKLLDALMEWADYRNRVNPFVLHEALHHEAQKS